MYLINTELTVNWYVITGVAPPALSDFNITIVPPNGKATYLTSAITNSNDYVPSTVSTKGFISYKFTPNLVGLWTISLNEGTSASNVDHYTHNILVSINDTLIKKTINSSLL